MIVYAAKRLGALVVLLVVLSAVLFLLRQLGAGDPVRSLLGPNASQAAVAAERLAPLGGRGVRARVEDALASALPADAVLVNPPRTGLDAAVPEILERAAAGAFGPAPRALVYVSCNPATLARDLARLPSYAVRRATPYDMFPQTAHVETLVVLAPAAEAPL